MHYDVIVIGAGLAGLISALKLCKNGKKVALFEKHRIPGGYATNFARKGKDGNLYTFDVSLHSLSGANEGATVYNILNTLGVTKDVEFLPKKENSVLIKNNKKLYIPNDHEKYKQTLIENYPSYKENIESLFKYLHDLYDNMIGLSLEKTIPRYEGELTELTLHDFLKKFVDNDDFIEDFSYLWVYAGLPPSKLSAPFALSMITSYIFGGENYVRGGGGQLSKVIKEHIEACGGDVFLSSEIMKITADGEKITSVTTKNDETFTGDTFIFAGDPINTFSIIENSNLATKYLEVLNEREKSTAITQLYVAIDCSTEEIGIEDSHLFFYGKNNSDEIYEKFKQGDLEDLSFIVTAYDKLDPELNKHGAYFNMAILDYAHNWPERGTDEYKEKKKQVIDLFMEKLTNLYPKLKDHVQVVELGTPRTTQRYTNNTGGTIYGWAQTIDQGGTNRKYLKTPFKNVVMAGAWSHPGGGYEGAIFSGLLAGTRTLMSICDGSETGLMPISQIMEGLIKKFNPDNAKDVDLTFKFCFEGHDPIYLQVKDQKACLLDEVPGKIDTTLTMTHKTWYQIAFEEISGRDALFDGLVKCDGNLRAFASIPTIFNKPL